MAVGAHEIEAAVLRAIEREEPPGVIPCQEPASARRRAPCERDDGERDIALVQLALDGDQLGGNRSVIAEVKRGKPRRNQIREMPFLWFFVLGDGERTLGQNGARL